MNIHLSKIFNDIEKASLSRLADDLTTTNALKKLFLFGLYYNGTLKEGQDPDPLTNWALRITETNNFADKSLLSNEQIGSILRAKTEGIITVELGFRELETFKTVTESKAVKENPGK